MRFFAEGERGGRELPDGNDRLRKEPDKEKPKKKRGNDKFIEKTVLLYKKQVPRNTIYREALILLKGIISVRTS